LYNERDNRRRRTMRLKISGATLVVAALISGCGGGGAANHPGGQSAATHLRTQFVGYASCMRSHGLSGYPDPQVSSSGSGVQVAISPGSTDPNSPAFKSADHACRHLLPNGGSQTPPGGNTVQQQSQDVRFAACMRSHGVPGFPDPGRDGVFTVPASINEQAPAFLRATRACQAVEPSSMSLDQSS
jgi:hypothetical protein